MIKHDTKLPACSRHKTPKDVAEYMRSEGRRVGRIYETHGSVWGAPDDLQQVGLLHLVVDRLEEINKVLCKKPLDMLAGQSAWLLRFHSRAVEAIAEHKRQCDRIAKFCDIELLRGDAEQGKSIHDLSREYRLSFAKHEWLAVFECGKYYQHNGIIDIESKTKRLRSVKSLNDIEKLRGIGYRTGLKIREKMRMKKEKIAGDD